MLASPETRPDRRPSIVICAYDVADGGWDAVEDLSGAIWHPAGARTVPVAAGDPTHLADLLGGHLRDADCRALLLVGRTRRSDGFRVQMRAENRTLDGAGRLSETGPAMARATAPVAEMVRALKDAGLTADASSDDEDDAGGFLLYSILAGLPDDVDVPAVGLLRAPAGVGQITLDKGVRAAAAAIARHLSPLPRARQH